jgi:hypothetical protein
MQQLAKKQEEKYTGMMRNEEKCGMGEKKDEGQKFGFSSIEDDQFSLELNGFYDYKERIEDDFNIFDDHEHRAMTEETMFYSKQEI